MVVPACPLLSTSAPSPADGHGLIRAARLDPAFPYAVSPILAQTEWILDQADALCQAAGASLDAVARQQLFYTDLRDVAVSFRTLAARFGDGLPATSVVRVPATPVPGCGLVADMWVVMG